MESLRRATAADAPAMRRIAAAAYSPYVPRMEGRRPGPLDADYAAAVADSEAWVVEADGRRRPHPAGAVLALPAPAQRYNPVAPGK